MSDPSPTVLAVGSTGRLAGLVVPELARRGANVRGRVRERGATEIAVGAPRGPDSMEAAARGADGVFHIGPAFHPDRA